MKKQKDKLDCLQAAKMIPEFIGGKMPYRELERFVRHIQECDGCREELSIQFLVKTGLASLEAGDTFDLQEELDEALENAYRKAHVYHFVRQSAAVLGIVAIAAAVLTVILFMVL